MKKLVMVGLGHSNLVALGDLMGELSSEIEVVLISDVLKAPYSGMLPGFMAGHFQEEEMVFDLVKLATHYQVHFIHAEVTHIDTKAQTLGLTNGETIRYDCLSVNTGILPQKIECEDKDKERLVYVKPLSHFIPKWKKFLSEEKNLRIAVVGAGSAGCEIATAISLRCNSEVSLYTKSNIILTELPNAARKKISDGLKRLQVRIEIQSQVHSFREGKLFLTDGRSFDADYVFMTTGAVPHTISGNLPTDDKGFIVTNNKLLVEGTDNVFAAGDCITFNHNPLPKAGVFAVRQGPILANNIKAYLSQAPMIPYKPQKSFLKILITGDKEALACKGSWTYGGSLAWYLKRYIDKKFMNKYQT